MSQPVTRISDRPSLVQDDIIRFIYRHQSMTGTLPNPHQISRATSVLNIKYHLKRIADRGYMERPTVEAILSQSSPKTGVGKLPGGSCPERARKIVSLLISDHHAVDRFARLFCGEWQRGVAL